MMCVMTSHYYIPLCHGNWLKLPNVHPVELARTNEIGNIVFCSYSLILMQDELVDGAISSAVYNHPSLKELTSGYRCPPSLVNGTVEGIVRKADVKKLVLTDNFPGEL